MRPDRAGVAAFLLFGALAPAFAGPAGNSAADQASGAPAVGAPAAAAPAVGSPAAASVPEDFDPVPYIGLDLKSAVGTLGAPQEVFSFRGPDENQDNVVFYYPDFVYLFWYRNRVWQVRCDRRFPRPLFGVAMGMPREVIQRTSPRRLSANGDSLYFDIDDGKYPLRVRMVFANDALSDIYIYRSDF